MEVAYTGPRVAFMFCLDMSTAVLFVGIFGNYVVKVHALLFTHRILLEMLLMFQYFSLMLNLVKLDHSS